MKKKNSWKIFRLNLLYLLVFDLCKILFLESNVLNIWRLSTILLHSFLFLFKSISLILLDNAGNIYIRILI